MKNSWDNKINNDIDFVIAWVNGNDPDWQKQKKQYEDNQLGSDDSPVRYRDWENLHYWFRAVEKFAPWVRKIHFVTWGHLPPWLNTEHPKLHIVRHEEYIPKEYIPTFNSHTIELNLHRIQGLAEQFVYFNDDMFLINYVSPEDFFCKGLPCDTFALDAIYFGPNGIGHINGNNIDVINSHFKKRTVVRENSRKIFSYKYGIRLLGKTFCLLPWPWFPGIHYQHLPSPFLKSSFENIWKIEQERLNHTCKCRFRDNTNINQWVIKYWQLVTGNFYPRNPKIGRCFHLKDSNIEGLCVALQQQRYKMICINDTKAVTHLENAKIKVNGVFLNILNQKSLFER